MDHPYLIPRLACLVDIFLRGPTDAHALQLTHLSHHPTIPPSQLSQSHPIPCYFPLLGNQGLMRHPGHCSGDCLSAAPPRARTTGHLPSHRLA